VIADQAQSIAQDLGMHCAFGENRKLHGVGLRQRCTQPLPARMPSQPRPFSSWDERSAGCLVPTFPSTAPCARLQHAPGNRFLRAPGQQAREAGDCRPDARTRSCAVRGSCLAISTSGRAGRSRTYWPAEFQNADLRSLLKRNRTYPGFFRSCTSITSTMTRRSCSESVKLHRSRLALIASDHLPLIAEFRLKTA
jgi:hypothetical protein